MLTALSADQILAFAILAAIMLPMTSAFALAHCLANRKRA
jgi:hypothetical protein